jgi:hypothetical protein
VVKQWCKLHPKRTEGFTYYQKKKKAQRRKIQMSVWPLAGQVIAPQNRSNGEVTYYQERQLIYPSPFLPNRRQIHWLPFSFLGQGKIGQEKKLDVENAALMILDAGWGS